MQVVATPTILCHSNTATYNNKAFIPNYPPIYMSATFISLHTTFLYLLYINKIDGMLQLCIQLSQPLIFHGTLQLTGHASGSHIHGYETPLKTWSNNKVPLIMQLKISGDFCARVIEYIERRIRHLESYYVVKIDNKAFEHIKKKNRGLLCLG